MKPIDLTIQPQSAGLFEPLRIQATNHPPTLLLVDDEPNIVSSLRRLLRGQPYRIMTARSGIEGLDLMAEHPADVIISDQRMPGMTGVEFLRIVKQRYPDTLRIVLSGYTELRSVTDAINEGAIYKFLIKPWDDEQLIKDVAEAFESKRLADENRRLNEELRSTNARLDSLNRQLHDTAALAEHRAKLSESILNVTRDVLQHVPVPVICVDNLGVIVFSNIEANATLCSKGVLLGQEIQFVLPELATDLLEPVASREWNIQWKGKRAIVRSHCLANAPDTHGVILSIIPLKDGDGYPQ